MRIGIDLDGTAWEHREFFIEIIKGLKQLGHTICIITAHVNLANSDMELWKKRGFPTIDEYISKVAGEESIPSREWKLSASKQLHLDYIFDDFDTGDVRLIKI